jgi:hypothetical protein
LQLQQSLQTQDNKPQSFSFLLFRHSAFHPQTPIIRRCEPHVCDGLRPAPAHCRPSHCPATTCSTALTPAPLNPLPVTRQAAQRRHLASVVVVVQR